MIKKLKFIFFICKMAWIVFKWGFVYLVFKHHLKFFDFTYLMFRGFSYKFDHYAETIMNYEIITLCIAIFFVIRFFWKRLYISYFFRSKIKRIFYFFYFYGTSVGIYFVKFQYDLEHFRL